MTASSLIDSLAGRGLVLSIEGARIQVSPKRLLTDQDRHLIRQFRDDLFALLSRGVAAKTCEEAEREAIREEPPTAPSPTSGFMMNWRRGPSRGGKSGAGSQTQSKTPARPMACRLAGRSWVRSPRSPGSVATG